MDKHILLVEDEGSVAGMWQRGLQRKGYQVSSTRWESWSKSAQDATPDVVLVDIAAASSDCLDRCHRLQRDIGVPVLVLTENSDVSTDGEIELVHKPLRLESLLQRIDAALAHFVAHTEPQERSIQVGELILDMENQAVSKGGEKQLLPPKLFQLLHTFMTHAGQVLSRRQLMKEIWDTEYLGDTRTLYVHIRWLREKIEDHPNAPAYLRTVRGVGYRFDAPDPK